MAALEDEDHDHDTAMAITKELTLLKAARDNPISLTSYNLQMASTPMLPLRHPQEILLF